MAPDKKINKRKAAPATAAPKEVPPVKKAKKAAQKTENTSTKPAATKGAKKSAPAQKEESPKPVPVSVDSQPARKVKPRKRAADYLSDEEEEKTKAAPAPAASGESSSKKKKAQNGAAVPAPKAKESASSAKAANVKKGKEQKKAKEPTPEEESEEEVLASEDEDDDEQQEESSAAESEEDSEDEDDQTTALIQGFESSDDEDGSGAEEFKPGQEVPAIPDSKQVKRKLKNKKKQATGEKEEPGVVYVGRIPHGFYEHEMRAYFSQFGEITRLRLSRNRTTGRSKHFAFIEFASAATAKVVAETMDNYLMFGHILKCKFVAPEQVHPQLWKGANRRFKKTPWNDIERRRLEKPRSRDQWEKKVGKEEKKRAIMANKLKALGYEFEMPKLKKPEEVLAEKPATEKVENKEETPKTIEAAPQEPEPTPKQAPAKKGKKGKQTKEDKEAVTASSGDASKPAVFEPEQPKQETQSNKTKAAQETEKKPAQAKGKKGKKNKA